MRIITIGALESFVVVILVLFLGKLIRHFIKPLRTYNIPEPIIGGLVVAVFQTILRSFDIGIAFTLPFTDVFMLMFFSTVGLGANFRLIRKGGAKVFIFLAATVVFIILQDTLGVLLAAAMGRDPLIGLMAGSITLTGGHGTGAAWAQTFRSRFGIEAGEMAMAAATFGLVIGGVIGGPLGQRLIDRKELKSEYPHNSSQGELSDLITFDEQREDRITADSMISTLFMMVLCITAAKYISMAVERLDIRWLFMPDFVYALFIGVIIANIAEVEKFPYKMNIENLDMLGTISLSIFLGMTLISLRLWEIFDIALPLLIILIFQTALMILFARFVTFRIMGSDYTAAVISGGHCGFGMGATPTAVMNMGALVSRNGPAPQAFMVLPIVGAFFVDIANLVVLQLFISVIH